MNVSVLPQRFKSTAGQQAAGFIYFNVYYLYLKWIYSSFGAGLIKIKVALGGESRREEGNKRDPGLLGSWECRSVTVWMEMRAKNDGSGSECPSPAVHRSVWGRGEGRAHQE